MSIGRSGWPAPARADPEAPSGVHIDGGVEWRDPPIGDVAVCTVVEQECGDIEVAPSNRHLHGGGAVAIRCAQSAPDCGTWSSAPVQAIRSAPAIAPPFGGGSGRRSRTSRHVAICVRRFIAGAPQRFMPSDERPRSLGVRSRATSFHRSAPAARRRTRPRERSGPSSTRASVIARFDMRTSSGRSDRRLEA